MQRKWSLRRILGLKGRAMNQVRKMGLTTPLRRSKITLMEIMMWMKIMDLRRINLNLQKILMSMKNKKRKMMRKMKMIVSIPKCWPPLQGMEKLLKQTLINWVILQIMALREFQNNTAALLLYLLLMRYLWWIKASPQLVW